MSYPTSPDFTAINIRSEHNVKKTETRSGRCIATTLGSQRWAFTAKYDDMTRAEFAPVFGFLMSTHGGVDTFDITPPIINDAQGDVSACTLAGLSSAGDAAISVNITGTLKAGDFVKFSGHTKVYMVTEDRASGSAVDLKIDPPLISSVIGGSSVTFDNIAFRVRMNNDVQQVRLKEFDRYDFQVDFIEAI